MEQMMERPAGPLFLIKSHERGISMKKLKYICAALCALLVCLALMYRSAQEAEQHPQPYYGIPAVWTAESEPESYVIHQIAEDGTFLYILSDEHNGVVQVYDLDGTYLRTMAFFPNMNGAFRIAAQEDTLYVRDMKYNLYIFRGGVFAEFITRQNASAFLEGLDFSGNAAGYEMRDGSVWRVGNGEDICVLYRPKSAAAYQQKVLLSAGIIVMALLGVAGMICCRSRKNK